MRRKLDAKIGPSAVVAVRKRAERQDIPRTEVSTSIVRIVRRPVFMYNLKRSSTLTRGPGFQSGVCVGYRAEEELALTCASC